MLTSLQMHISASKADQLATYILNDRASFNLDFDT